MQGEKQNELLVELQRGLPLVRDPFSELGCRLGFSETEVLAEARRLIADGEARRFGAVFDLRRLGYRSALCAVSTTESDRRRLVPAIVAEPGVTHCYLRGWPEELDPDLEGGPGGHGRSPNLWFTIAAHGAQFDAEIARMRRRAAPETLYVLSAQQRFKIDVILDPRTRAKEETFPGSLSPDNDMPHEEPPGTFTEREKAVVRTLQENMPLHVRPFDAVAATLSCSPDELLELLGQWRSKGILRRIGIVLNHRKAGFHANGMCVWPVEGSAVLGAGRALAAVPEVTHCYRRPRIEPFPYDLYAMIHRSTWSDALKLFQRISAKADLTNGRVLFSLHEYKKMSPVYFRDGTDDCREPGSGKGGRACS